MYMRVIKDMYEEVRLLLEH